jgi:5-hydroxyisourate hydrolase-like protein (transthyretin family)
MAVRKHVWERRDRLRAIAARLVLTCLAISTLVAPASSARGDLLRVTMVAGGTLSPLANKSIILKERLPDGSLIGRVWTTTDAVGAAVFDPPGLGAGRVYVLEANSPWDGFARLSNDISAPGVLTFVVGNAPLHVTAVDGITSASFAGLTLVASERLADGSARTAASRVTDAQGRATFDLAGLGDDRIYFLSAAPFGGRWVNSDDLTAAGDYTFALGTVEVTLIDGASGTPLSNTDVTAKRRLADGTLQWTLHGLTDAQGRVRFDLPGLGDGAIYVLEAPSPVDGLMKRSNDLVSTGHHIFVVGRAPLRVHLRNALSGAPLAGVKIDAHQRMSAQQLQWTAQRTTDANGEAVFDLAGLGNGAIFVLSSTPYNGGIVYSEDLSSAGLYEFRVGTVELTVVNGADGTALAGAQVNALEKNPDGTLIWTKNGVTDAQGVIRFDLAGLGSGKVYRFGALSPADGTTKHSQDISQIGHYTFTVGNAPLRVTLQNAVSGAGVANVVITVAERLSAGTLQWIGRQRSTDALGRAVFDLEGLGSGRTYVLAARPYNGLWVYSDDLTQAGDHVFRVGNLDITAINGLSGARLFNHKVVAKEVLADGTRPWVAAGLTDAAGIVRFSLREGRRYVVEAASPVDGSTKRSAEITAASAYTFVVGSAALRVTLVNGLSGTVLPQMPVTAEEVFANGSTVWAAQRTTDASGMAIFDLAGLGTGRQYRLYTRPYNGGFIYTEALSQPGNVYFRVGTVPVTLIDGDNDVVLANKQINAVERLANGSRVWRASGMTDSAGIVRFDVAGLSDTISDQPYATEPALRAYAFGAVNPFGNAKEYFSAVSYGEGPVTLRIHRAAAQPFDGTAPTLTVASPSAETMVPANGFTVRGSASDNRQVAQVIVAVSDPVRGQATLTAPYNAATAQWSVAVAATQVSSGSTALLTVTAVDTANNSTSTTVPVLVVADSIPPSVDILSHAEGASAPSAGFLVHGTAADNFGAPALFATLDDGVLGRTIAAPLQLRADGTWTMAVQRGQVSEGSTAVLTVVASDLAGNQRSLIRNLSVTPVDFLIHHLANRITFGASAALLDEIQAVGIDAYIEQQLAPYSIDDGAAEARVGATAPATLAELQRLTLLRAIYSRRQLLEVLTQFWDNHFNTDLNKHGVIAYETNENASFRSRALGRFRDLLDTSATSPAMLVYLDNALSMHGNPNENYARELLELHTLGVDGGYTQADVEQVARAFTGWTTHNGAFFFDAAVHDTGTKVILGQTLPAGRGIADGQDVLDLLARHPSTARFICTKLSQLLVNDAPPVTLINRCATTFVGSDGMIADVVRLILRSPEFAEPTNFRAKVRTPLEMATFWARALEAETDAAGLSDAIREMGMTLFAHPIPTGWSETGDDWISTNLLLQRIRNGNRLARTSIAGTIVDLPDFFARHGHTTAPEIVGFLLQLLMHTDYSTVDYDVALNRLQAGGSFALGAPDAAARLQDLVATVLSFPGAQYQ